MDSKYDQYSPTHQFWLTRIMVLSQKFWLFVPNFKFWFWDTNSQLVTIFILIPILWILVPMGFSWFSIPVDESWILVPIIEFSTLVPSHDFWILVPPTENEIFLHVPCAFPKVVVWNLFLMLVVSLPLSTIDYSFLETFVS